MKEILLCAVVLAVAGCASFLPPSANIATSPQADAMRLCGALVDVTTPGFSLPAIGTLARTALDTAAVNKLGANPALAMRKCANMYDGLAD